jgi:HSP20 family molecular chaperone IbpA
MALTTTPFGVTPFSSLIHDFNRSNSLFENSMFDDLSKTWAPMGTHCHWDLVETPTHYRVHCDLPGVRMEDIDITVKDDMLKVTGKLFYS